MNLSVLKLVWLVQVILQIGLFLGPELGLFHPCLAARYHVVGHENEDQYIQMKSQYDISPGTVLSLPVDVPVEFLSIFGKLVPSLIRVDSSSPDFVYGAGDDIIIDLVFSDTVEVQGNPFLSVNLGCTEDSCVKKEVQSFVCYADYGKFAMTLLDQQINNIDANTTQDDFKYRLEEFEGINEVTIHYSETDDREYSGGRRICSSRGNNVTIIFEDVSFPQFAGDVPPIYMDRLNAQLSDRTGLPSGDQRPLRGLHSDYLASITSPTREMSKGYRATIGRANYLDGSGTNTIRFLYTVRVGDLIDELDVTGLYFTEGYITTAGANVSTAVPDIGVSGRYMSSQAMSLSFHRDIGVSTNAPIVVEVTSTDPNGVYTQGDIVTITVRFDLPIKIFNGHFFRVALSAGNFARNAIYSRQIDARTLEFKYTVEFGDSTTALEYTNTFAFQNVGNAGFLYRDTNSNDTFANTTLPRPKDPGSISYGKTIRINTAQPTVLTISYEEAAPSGNPTAGDDIIISTFYDFDVVVTGQPRIWVANTPDAIAATIRTAPANPGYSYKRAKPGSFAEVIVTLVINFKVTVGDAINVYLPGFELEGSSGLTMVTLTASTAGDFAGQWDPGANTLVLTSIKDIPSGTEVKAAVTGRSGLRLPDGGILGASNRPKIYINSDLASLPLQPFLTPWYSGFSAVSLTLSSNLHPGGWSTMALAFTVPEKLEVGDYIWLRLERFTQSAPADYDVTTDSFSNVAGVNWRQQYDASDNTMVLTLQTATAVKTFSLAINHASLQLLNPATGVGVNSIKFRSSTANNGDVDEIVMPVVTKLCSAMSATLRYGKQLAGAESALHLAWTAGPTDLAVGDRVVVVLPASTAASGTNDVSAVTTVTGGAFTVSITATTVTFTV